MDQGNLLLLTCLRKDHREEKISKLENFGDKEWTAVLNAAFRFGLAPLLFNELKPLVSKLAIPTVINDKLQNAYYVSAIRNLDLYRQLAGILELFNKEEIAVILLKGAHLAECVYGNSALRPMADLDILAKNDDLSKIDQILINQGYRTSKQDIGFSLLHLPVYTKENAISIEVHSTIFAPPVSARVNIAELWERKQVESMQGFKALTLCPDDLLLHLCVHSCIDHTFNNGIMPFVDIALTLEHYRDKLDWGQILIRSRKWGICNCVYLMLTITERMTGLSVPEMVLQQLRPDDHNRDMLDLAETLVFERGDIITSYIARLFGRESWSEKLKYVKARVIPSKESILISGQEAMVRNPIALFRFYWSRIRSMLDEHGRTIWAVLRKDKDTITALRIQNDRNQLKDWLLRTKQQD